MEAEGSTSYGDQVRAFGVPIYLLCAYVLVLYAAIIPLNNFTSDMLQLRFELSEMEAGHAFGNIHAVAGITLVAVGLYQDRYGNLGLLLIFAAIAALAANLWWVLYPPDACLSLPNSAYGGCRTAIDVPIFAMGLAYGLVSGTASNSLIYMVPKCAIGTALGLIGTSINVGLALTSLLYG